VLTLEEKGFWWEKDARDPVRHAFRKRVILERLDRNRVMVRKSSPDGGLLDLLTLERTEIGIWSSPRPHVCLQDVYRAEFSLDDSEVFTFRWWSEGPEKNYEILTRYLDAHLTRAWLES